MNQEIPRRDALKKIATGTVALTAAPVLSQTASAAANNTMKLKGNIRHSVCKWCYKDLTLEQMCEAAVDLGLEAIDLVDIKDFPTLQKHGLKCAMVSGVPGGIVDGMNRPKNHDRIVAFFEEAIPQTAAAGFENVICFSGNRDGMSDEEGLEHCVTVLKRVAPIAEMHGVNVCMELLNSRHNHPDYMCDHTEWGVEMCRAAGSDRIKLLYDIYHMQIMEGDMIDRIRKYHTYIGHYHTGGVPGRNEIDETQEIYYPAVMRAILETGYKGFVAQEFIPRNKDVIASLRQSVEICDV